MLPIVLQDVRRQLRRCPLSNRPLEHPLFVSQGEVDHENGAMLSREPDDVHRRTARYAEQGRDASAVGRNLELVGATE